MLDTLEADKQGAADSLPYSVLKSRSPEDSASWFSRLNFLWMNGILWQAGRGTLTPSSLLDLPSGTDGASLEALMQSRLDKQSGSEAISSRALLWLVLGVFRRTLFLNAITRFVADACAVGQPILLSFLIRLISQQKKVSGSEDHVALILVLVMALLLVAQTFATKMHTQSMATLGLKIKVGLNALIYRKALATGGGETVEKEASVKAGTEMEAEMKAKESGSVTSSKIADMGSHDASGTGRIVNLLSGDTRRIESFVAIIHFIWSGILQAIAVVVLLILDLGVYSALAGLALILVSLPFQFWVMQSSSRSRALASHYSDLRVKAIRESFTFIRLLKTYCWEPVWESLVKVDRALELKYIERMNLGRVYLSFSSISVPILASIAALMTWVWRHPGASLTSEIVFPTLSLFSLLRIPLTNYPYIVMMSIDANVALQRISKLLNQSEKKNTRNIDATQAAAIVYKWEEEEEEEEIVIEKGKLTVIVGAVGSGKTRLLHALFGDNAACDHFSHGTKSTTLSSDHVVFSPRQCWLQNCTIKDNILFGRSYHAARYTAVLAACELDTEPSDEFPYGDATMAGEDGSCLSAGQRARVCLARAVYVRPDILLLDDPMAAVDGAVGHRIHLNLLKGDLLVENGSRTTIVMTTHQMKWLSLSDSIIVLDHGVVIAHGPWSQLQTSQSIRKLFGTGAAAQSSTTEDPESDTGLPHSSTRLEAELTSPILSKVEHMDKAVSFERPFTPVELAPGLGLGAIDMIQSPFVEDTEEERLYGPVSFSIYAKYIKLAGGWVLFFLLASLSIIAVQVFRLGTDLWITMWVAHGRSNTAFRTLTEGQMQAIYVVLGCAQLLVGGLSALIFVYCGIVAARRCHATALSSVLKAPMSFFDSNPIGRLLNRFSRDIDAIDTCLMESFRQVLMKSAFAICTVIMIAVLVPILLAPLAGLVFAYYGLQCFYRPACRELSRIASVLRSPYYAHVNESLSSGSLTSQSYPHAEALFLRKGYQVLDESQRPIYALYSAKNWADLRIELVGHVSFLIAALICLYTHLSPSMVGLIMSYSRNFSSAVYWFIYSWIDLEIYSNSLERLFHYSNWTFEFEKESGGNGDANDNDAKRLPSAQSPFSFIKKSAQLAKKEKLLAGSSLSEPILEFDQVSLGYRNGLPNVLSSISFKVAPGEKIGIVGRTGAGKSTLLLALFRLIDPCEGVIRLHGDNIQTLGLRALRRRMAMVPQEPVIFAGSIRFNLDPSNSYPEYDLWCALEKAHMRNYVQALPDRLDTILASNDSRLSVGQRQLICLARALLLNTSLLLFDETSAHMDYETDALLQNTIHSPEFRHITVLTIAHRLSSLKRYDKILYLADGKIVRMDTPQNILTSRSNMP